MISWADLQAPEFQELPDEAKPTAQALWLLMDPLGRGPMDVEWLAASIYPRTAPAIAQEKVLEHLVAMIETGFLTTYRAEQQEWILLLAPLKVDSRRARIDTPEPPEEIVATRPRRLSMDVHGYGAGARGRASGRARASVRERARERAEAQVRAEDAARADAWAALQSDQRQVPDAPERPLLLDAPPMFCSDHMPAGAGKQGCGPCRDARVIRDDWITRRVYEGKLAQHHEAQAEAFPDEQDFPESYEQPNADTRPW